jgi:putative DNA primase/helicase
MGMLARALNRDRINMEHAFSSSRLGQRKKWSRADYRKRTIDKALEGVPPASAVSLDSAPLSLADSGNAELVLKSLGPRALYCKPRGEWFLADQTERWTLDRTNRLAKLVQETMQRRWQELAAHPDPKDPQWRHSLRSLDYHAIRSCVSILEFQQQLCVLPESLDCDPLMLGVQNGILSLLLGELVPPRLDLLVTKCAPTRFDPAAKCDRFLEYLERVQPEEENRRFLQRLAGSLLTGLQPEQAIVFFYGVGANGKSVFLRVLSDVLGPDYSFKARKQLLFLSGRHSLEHGTNDVADLEGKRLITSTEQTGKRWNWEFLKDFSGGELQHGRQLYKTAGNFKPAGKIVVSANQQPALTEFDEAVRRRFVCLPWKVIIPEKERVAPLELYVSSLLRDGGASGFLNWAQEGLIDLVKRNWRLDPPKAAVDATDTYIKNEDRVRRFFQDWFEDGAAMPLTTKELRKYFVAWLDEPEKFVMSPKAFTRECQRIFGDRCHIHRSNCYVVEGLRLSARGQAEYREHQPELFSETSSEQGNGDAF